LRILLVEDDVRIVPLICKGLEDGGFSFECADNGEEGLRLALSQSYDAAVIDIMLPKVDGITLIEEMRKKNIKMPVIILSALGSVEDRVRGLEIGSDDYLTKPFAMSELLARLQALIRRTQKSAEPVVLTAGELSMDLVRHEVIRAGKHIALQPREYALLEYMMRNAETVISKAMIIKHVLKYDFDPQTNIVDVLVFRLRKKIDDDFDFKMIHTIRGFGHILKISAKKGSKMPV
jgi:two-component system OmpR family response regulator